MTYLVFKQIHLYQWHLLLLLICCTQSFLKTSLFTTVHSFLKLTETVINLPISILSNSAFKLAKSDFDARLDASTPVAPF